MHFVLVHGSYHGAWCWEDLRAELARGGHASTAVDLPTEDPDAGAELYVDEILHMIPRRAGEVVMVAHSLAGLSVPIAASRTRTAMTIYLCAILPVPGLSWEGQRADFTTGFTPSESAIGNDDGSASWPERGAIEVFYHDCSPEVAQMAAKRLRRQHWKITREITPLRQWPAVRAAYILCADDRMVATAYSRRAARLQLGVDPIELPGGHSPFLSRPRVLAQTLVRVAAG
jgi:hypothetical protein